MSLLIKLYNWQYNLESRDERLSTLKEVVTCKLNVVYYHHSGRMLFKYNAQIKSIKCSMSPITTMHPIRSGAALYKNKD